MKLNKVCKIIGGNPAPKEGFSSSAEALPFVKMKDLGRSHLTNNLIDIEARIDPIFAKEKRLKIIKKGSVLLPRSGSVALNHRAILGQDSHMVSHICALEVIHSDLENTYLYYFLRAKRLDNITKKTTGLDAITFEDLGNIDIHFPEIDKQKQIVQTLDTADTIRQKRKEQLNLLDDYFKSVFFEMFGDSIHNGKKWKFCEVHNLCSKVIDCPHSTPKYADVITDYPCIRSSDLQDGFIDYTTTKYVDYSAYQDRTQRCVPDEGDVIYCREGARYGSSGYLSSGVKACLGQRTMMFRAMPDKVTSEFLWGLISSDSIYFQARQMAGGAASPHINVKDIKKFKAFFPPIELQKEFTNIFKLIQTTKQKMRASLDVMDNHFNALMQRYFG